MKRNTHNSTLSISQSTPEVSHKDAVTSTESHPSLDVESTATNNSTYASFYWLINYIKMCISRLANDLYTSLMSYWFPGRVMLPPHILHLMLVQNRLRAERESHTVTYSRELPGASSPLSMSKIFNAFTSYILSSEDEAVIQYTPQDLAYLKNDRKPMFVIVDSSFVSNSSSNDKRFHVRDPILKRHFNKNVKSVEVPSTSRDLRTDLLGPLMESDSTDEMQMIDMNLRSDNDPLISADSECENDSIVMYNLKKKDAFLDLEDFSDESLLDVFIPSFPPSPRSFSYDHLLEVTRISNEEEHFKLNKVTDFLLRDHEFLIAAELGDENMLRILIEKGTNIQVKDNLGRNALHLAVCSGEFNVVARLLTAGVEPNVKDDLGLTPLSHCLMRRPCLKVASLLLDQGALFVPRCSPMDTSLFFQFVMMCIPTKEEENILRLLAAKGALVNDPDSPGGRQPLHFAAMSNNTYLIHILVELGANLFDVNHRNETPKQVAATFNCKEAYALLEHYEELVHDG